jgi:hypothetical protein
MRDKEGSGEENIFITEVRGDDGVRFAAPSSRGDGRWLAVQVGKWPSKWVGDDCRLWRPQHRACGWVACVGTLQRLTWETLLGRVSAQELGTGGVARGHDGAACRSGLGHDQHR